MSALALVVCGIVTALIGASVFLVQWRLLATGKVIFDEHYNGPEIMRKALLTLMRIFFKRTIVWRKLFFQYMLHVWVRFLYYVDRITTSLYARSRNFFVKNAVKNKSSVPHFWEHLKVYKQEIDKEKEGEL